MAASKFKTPVHAPPLIFPPSQDHKTTLVILHGRGSTAPKFAEPLLKHLVYSTFTTSTSSADLPAAPLKPFRDHFPHAKFIFPTAPLRRAVVFNRSLTHQWFDNWSLTEPETKQDLQIQGLRESTAFLHDLLGKEIQDVGPENVVLMGLSQGCAASMVATLLWKDRPFGALVGMCGYLPFRKAMYNLVEGAGIEHNDSSVGFDEEADDMFERSHEEAEERPVIAQAVEWLRDELQIDEHGIDCAASHPIQLIPVFMGHGAEDQKVPIAIGRLAAELLRDIEVDTIWKEYEDLDHWYSEDMLRDIVVFLKDLKGWANPP
jgi:predicted esterase